MKSICGITLMASLIAFFSIAVADPQLLGVTVPTSVVLNDVVDAVPIDVGDLPLGDTIARFLKINSGEEIDRLVKDVFTLAEGVRILGDVFIPKVATPLRNYTSALVRVAFCVTRNGANLPQICNRNYSYEYEGVTYNGDPKNATNVFSAFRADNIVVNVEDAFLQGYTYENDCEYFPDYAESIIRCASVLRELSSVGENFSYDDVKTALEKIIEAFAIIGETFQRGLGEKIINGLVYFVNNFTPQFDFIPIDQGTIKEYLTRSNVSNYEPFLSDTCNRETLLDSTRNPA